MKRHITILSALLLFVSSCNENEEPRGTTIGPSGGFVREDGVGIDIPPGALETSVELAIERVPVPSGFVAAGGAAYRFRPEGIRFSVPVTVRFAIDPGEEDATIYWSDAANPDLLVPVATHIDGGEATASVEHFSIGLAGWKTADAGPEDRDAGTRGDAGAMEDGGVIGPDAGPLPGITCIVDERNPDCVSSTTTTYDDVPFYFHPHVIDFGSIGALTSPLAAFNRLYNLAEPEPAPFVAVDPAGSHYTVGASESGLTRNGLVVSADVDAARGGSACIETPGAIPLIRIRCTGSTELAPPACLPVDVGAALGTALSCSVTRRDASCTTSRTTETPRFWLAAGAHGPESELRTDSPVIVELFGSGGDARFYREGPCDAYAADVGSASGHRFARFGDRIAIDSLQASGPGTCRDDLGRSQPTLAATCRGEVALGPPP